MPADVSVEERLEKARLLPRITQEVLTMCKSVDQLLHAQHVSNLAQAIICVQELARDHYAVVIALKWVILLVDMLESDTQDVRLASCNAIAAVSVVQEGRDAVRCAGGLRPLVMLLAEGSRSQTAAAAASALMNCSACDTCKEAIADCRGVPMLLGLIREAVLRVNPASSSSSASSHSARDGGPAAQDLRTPGDCKAAVFAAGALMNMGGVISVQEKLLAAGAVNIFEATLRVSQPGDVVATRANFMLSWLAVASGATGHADKRGGHHHHHQHHQQGTSPSADMPGSAASTPRSLASQQSIAVGRSAANTPRDGPGSGPAQQPQPRVSSAVVSPGSKLASGGQRAAGRTTEL